MIYLKLIKCDICKKEIDIYSVYEGYLGNKIVDLCPSCADVFNSFKKDFISQEKQLQKEYEEKRQAIYNNTIKKYGLNEE